MFSYIIKCSLLILVLISISTVLLCNSHSIATSSIDYHYQSTIPIESITADDIQYYSYHLHTYYLPNDNTTVTSAISLRQKFIQQFNPINCPSEDCNPKDLDCNYLCVWPIQSAPIGPHPLPQFGIYIPIDQLQSVSEFMQIQNNGQLYQLIHPNSGYPEYDHVKFGSWVKGALPLNVDAFKAN